ncbi:MAG: hypothetical protein ACN4G0_19205 [Polyangiales bacterium]
MPLLRFVATCVFLLTIAGCSSTDGGGNIDTKCQQACDAIETACMSTESDCGQDCTEDLADCPSEMGAVLDCVLANTSRLQCDPEEDQGLAEAPCEAEHMAVAAPPCEKDPF